MRWLVVVLVALVFSWSRVASADTFNAEAMTSESEPRPKTEPTSSQRRAERPRRDPALFAAGLTTAIGGGVAMNVGAVLLVAGATSCTGACEGSVVEMDEGMLTSGAVTIAVGALMVAAGIPMAVIGGRREPASANGGLVVLSF